MFQMISSHLCRYSNEKITKSNRRRVLINLPARSPPRHWSVLLRGLLNNYASLLSISQPG